MIVVGSDAPQVRFVYLSDKSQQGSTAMRAHQLCAMLRPHMPGADLALEEIRMPPPYLPARLMRAAALRRWARAQPSGAVLIFTKACLRVLTPQIIEHLRARNIKICLDHVDSDFRQTSGLRAHIHICTSYAQQDAIAQYQLTTPSFEGVPMVLLHNYDISLVDHPPAQQDRFRGAYIGTPEVGYLPPQIAPHVEVIAALGKRGWQAVLPRLGDYSLHYCLRLPQPEGSRLIKPFTKGAVAAKLGVPVVVNRQTEDAERMLGGDYPYMVDHLTPEAAVAMLHRARDDFGGPTWELARQHMAHLAQAVSPQALAAQLRAILDHVKDL